ncbi:hypothetical protein DACRYDRAFT_44421, partial [Dacryopinax primogenitus]
QCCKQIRLAYTPIKGWHMESANRSVNQLLGHIPNLCIGISSLNFYVQAFILPNPPFHLLLSRPFHVLASCITQDYTDGKQKIQITCPNSHQTINLWMQSHQMGRKQVVQDFSFGTIFPGKQKMEQKP